jgi:hypothetical protein
MGSLPLLAAKFLERLNVSADATYTSSVVSF